MGRYVRTGTAQANSCIATQASTCYQVACQKYAYDTNSCWQNRIIVDTPGSYTFTVPSGVSCVRVVAVGGGGKSYCNCSGCIGTAGAGGGYSEAFNTINAGCAISIVVGRQQQDTTISYVCSGGVTRTITAGGAVGYTPGSASGGDLNSIGGTAGRNCNYCGGSFSHYCGSCIYQYATTCCGYCVVWSGISARTVDPDHGSGGDCCNARYAGGGSAGSYVFTCGGAGQDAYNNMDYLGQGYGASAGGGGGIGYILRTCIRSPGYACVCLKGGYSGQSYGITLRNQSYMNQAGGGGGTKWQCCSTCEMFNYVGVCQSGRLRNGPGGWGSPNNNEGREQEFYWGWSEGPNGHGNGWFYDRMQGPSPQRYPWHDIHEMQGSGSSGRSMLTSNNPNGSNFLTQIMDCMPDNAGEGAGTGGIVYYCCALTTIYQHCCFSNVLACGTVNWTLLCCLGTSGRICCADRFEQQLFPYIISCAGTLGGAGGVGICHLASKAGKGGGSGVNRSYILCVCWGGTYNTCNGDGVTTLAFPPCDLDWRVSTAGTGMAIIYWKDAS